LGGLELDVPGAARTEVAPAASPFIPVSDLFFPSESDLDAAATPVAPAAGGDDCLPPSGAAAVAGATVPVDFGCASAEPLNMNPKDNPKNKTFQNRIFDPLELAGRIERKTLDHGAAQFVPSKLQSLGNRKDF